MARHIDYGKEAEKAACDFLERAGYRILHTNYRYKRAEIDIIASHGQTLVFAEVKARSVNRFGYPEEAVNPRKQELLLMAAAHFVEETNWQHDSRFDVISITGSGSTRQIHHIADAFH